MSKSIKLYFHLELSISEIYIKKCSIKSCFDDPTLLLPEGAVEGRDPGALKMNKKNKK